MNPRNILFVATALSVCTVPALAQQAIHTPAAAHTSTGVLMVRELAQFTRYSSDPTGLDREVDDLVFITDLAYGVSHDTVIMLRVPVFFRDIDSDVAGVDDSAGGFGDIHAMAKMRIWQNDFGPIDTARLGVVAGIDLPTARAPFGSDSFDPMLGLVYTHIQGRHGFNASARYKINTGGRDNAVRAGDSKADILRYDTAYLYRIAPAEYAVDTQGAWYAIAELHGMYETNGDHELFTAPCVV